MITMITEKMDRHDLAQMRDDIAAILLAVSSMKSQINKSDMADWAKKQMVHHFQEIEENLNFQMVLKLRQEANSGLSP